MTTATARTPAFHRAVFEDGLGTRHHADAPSGEPLELLELRDEFRTDDFEAALRERVAALTTFQTTFFAQVRSVQRHQQNAARLFVLSDRVAGARLSSVLASEQPQFTVNASLCLVRQLMAAIALLHEKLPGIAHGSISAERLIITPKARLVVVDHAFGLALQRLGWPAEQYWDQLRIPVPPGDRPAFDQRLDVLQIGVLALELILGRPIDASEYPGHIPDLVDRACVMASRGDAKAVPEEFRAWLLRMLQLDADEAFSSAADAWADLEHVLVGTNNAAAFATLEAIMTEYGRKLAGAPQPVVSPQAVTRKVLAAVPTPARVAIDVDSDEHVERDSPMPPSKVVQMPRPAAADKADMTATTPPQSPPIERPATPEIALPFAETSQASPSVTDEVAAPTSAPSSSRRWLAIAAVLVLVLGGGAYFGRQMIFPSAAAEAPGTLIVTTNPAGYQVFVDGQPRGVTPLTIELAPGAHELRLATEGEPRVIPVVITAGGTVSQSLELPRLAPTTGQLSIRSEPAGARVTIDGTPSGTTPLTVDSLAPGTHSVTLESDVATVTQEVTIQPGIMASLVVPMTAPEGVPVSGWISVSAPAEIEIREGGQLLGTSQTDRVMVSAGRHELELVNAALGYRITRVVTVQPGKVSPITLEWPKGSLAVNAQPWADVWIGGTRVGETPIGNIPLPLGTHEITFRHPELGEQVVRATVTAGAPTRVSVDMRKR